jgi:hypothetical protein
MRRIIPIAIIAGLLAPAGEVFGQGSSEEVAHFARLDRAERHLLAAIHAIRSQPPGPERNAALDEVRRALVRTQEARGGVTEALETAGSEPRNLQRSARAVFQAVSQAQDAAVSGDRARVDYAINRAEHALSMAALNPIEREVVDSWLDEARSALYRDDRHAVRQSLEQAE